MEETFIFPGGGNLYASYNGQGNNTVSFTADPNEGEEDRELMLTFRTYSNSMSTQRKVIQRGAEIGEYVFTLQEFTNSSSGTFPSFIINVSNNEVHNINIPFTVTYSNGNSYNGYTGVTSIATRNLPNILFNKGDLRNCTVYFNWTGTSTTKINISTFNAFTNIPQFNALDFCNAFQATNSFTFTGENVKVTNLYFFMWNQRYLKNVDISTLNTSICSDLLEAFTYCNNISNWDFLNNWDLNNITNGRYAFANSSVSFVPKGLRSLINGREMFYNCKNLVNFSAGDLNCLEDCQDGFWNCTNLDTISFGNFNSLTNSAYMFNRCTISNSLTLGHMPVLESSHNMFYNCNCPTIIMDSAGLNGSNMFYNCNHTYNVTIKDTSRLENASHMFNGCHNIVNLDSSNWTLSNLTNAANMFANCINLQDFNTSHWNLANLVDGSYMFYNCGGLTHFEAGDLEHMTNGYEGFTNCNSLNTITIGNLPSMIESQHMFYYSRFHYLSIGNMPALTQMWNMFQNCINAESIHIENLTNVVEANYAFSNCQNLSDISLGNFDNLEYATGMFQYCYNLTGNIFITSNRLAYTTNMFQNAGRNSTGFNVYAYEGTETWNRLSASNAYLNYGNLIPITD